MFEAIALVVISIVSLVGWLVVLVCQYDALKNKRELEKLRQLKENFLSQAQVDKSLVEVEKNMEFRLINWFNGLGQRYEKWLSGKSETERLRLITDSQEFKEAQVEFARIFNIAVENGYVIKFDFALNFLQVANSLSANKQESQGSSDGTFAPSEKPVDQARELRREDLE